MKFKEFLQLKENEGSDRGLMGYGEPCQGKKPSDGQMPLANNSQPMAQNNIKMMRKKMKKN